MSKPDTSLRDVWSMIGGLRIYARVSAGPSAGPVASGLPLVALVHGLSVSSDYMIPTAVRLARHTWVGAPDLPGFGKSERPRRIFDLDAHAEVLAAWMAAVGLTRAALLGNSLGCQLIAHFAGRYPWMVGRAILAGPALDPHAGTVRQVGRLLLDGFREPVRYLPLLAHDYLSAGLGRTWRTFRAALHEPIEAMYARMSMPTLVVRGGRDPIVTQNWAKELAQLLPDGRLVVIEGAAHAVNFNAPERLVEVALPFMAEGAVRATPQATARAQALTAD
jgi:2-hydroxy-6-oxonona-2,4-dienedioate hydrolase